MQYVDSRTLNLNSQAGQIVETGSRQITIGAGYKLANFNKIIKIGSRQGGVSNDLSLDLDLNFASNSSLIRKIETAYTQATQGTKSFSINFMASYVLSRRITLAAYFDHQVNTPLVSSSAFPTSNSNFECQSICRSHDDENNGAEQHKICCTTYFSKTKSLLQRYI